MGVILCRWCLFSVQIILMFAVISIVLPSAESTSAPETSSIRTSTAAAVTTIQTTTVTTTRLTTTAPTPPDHPTGVTVLSVNSETLDVSWVSHINTKYCIVHVTGISETLNVTGNSSKVSGLKGGTYYVIHIEACAQPSVCSNASDAEGSNTTYPAEPRNFSLTDRSSSSFSFSWTQHYHVDHFVVTVDYDDSHRNVTNDIIITPNVTNGNVTTVNCDIRGLLVPGGNYTVIVSAFANTLNSSLHNDSQPTPFLTKPDQPQNVTTFNRTTDSLWITWSQFGVVESFSWSVNDTNMTRGGTLYSPSNNTGCYSSCSSFAVYLDVTGLQTAGEMYSIEIIANVSNVTSDPQTVSYATVPNVPESFSSEIESFESINLAWTKPAGNLHVYELFFNTNGSAENTTTTADESYVLTSLLSDSNYTITLRSKSFDQSSVNTTTSNWTLPNNVTEVIGSPQQKSVIVTWKPPQRHANVCLYQLIIAEASDCVQFLNLLCKVPESCRTPILETCSSMRNDNISNCNEMLSYTFEGLKYSTEYNITIVAVNPGGRSQPEGIKNIKTLAETVNDNGWIAGVVIGCLLAILLIIAIVFLFLRWRQEKSPFGGRNRSPSMSEKGGEENLVYEEEPEPVAVEAFVDYTKKMSQDSNYLYACEYMLLAKLSAKNTTVAAELPDNRIKNRYTDILPYDNSRVKLIPNADLDEGDGSDYINASFMPGFNSQREYIAAQGPMRSTVDDFWLMIWQQNVNMVVMVTNLTERGREKCEQYWPDDNEPLCYGNINVLLKSETSQDFYTIRVLDVSLGAETRQISQYHFLTWPDFGVPEDMEHILTFVKDIRNSIQGTAPVLVHCSAGVGRTGTFIVVDHLLQLIKREQQIDLFHLVLDLRQHRPKMIQAESQYVFAHECIKMAIEKGLHRDSSMIIDEDEQANGECLYANASETTKEKTVSLYANASDFHEQSV